MSDPPGYVYTNDKSNPITYLRSQEQMVREIYAFVGCMSSSHRSCQQPRFVVIIYAQAREYEVKVATVRLLQEEIKFCYRNEGTNHYQNCRDLTQKYRQMIKVSFAATPPRARLTAYCSD
jgi:hypothetical protein